jgi:hypothetical protein
MPPVGFEHTILAVRVLQTYAYEGTTTETGFSQNITRNRLKKPTKIYFFGTVTLAVGCFMTFRRVLGTRLRLSGAKLKQNLLFHQEHHSISSRLV